MRAQSAVMGLVVDHTLVMVSASHGSAPAASRLPPQRSTTVSPSSTTATEAPTSRPSSKWAVKASRTAAKRASQLPSTPAIDPGLEGVELGEEPLHPRGVALHRRTPPQGLGERDPPPDEQH